MQPEARNALIVQVAEAEVAPFRRTTPAHMHDDLMQEAMIGAWKALEQLDGDRTPREQQAWLGRAARSKALSFLRYMQVRKREVPDGEMFRQGEDDAKDRALNGYGAKGRQKQTLAAQVRLGEGVRPDHMVEAHQLARRIETAVDEVLGSLKPSARRTVEARLGLCEMPEIPRRRRDEHVRVGRERLQAAGVAAGLSVDLGEMIACQ